MLASQTPPTVDQTIRLKSGRKPLQQKNPPANPLHELAKTKPKQEWIEISLIGDSNKENHPIYATPTKMIEPFGASLAEELSVIRKKLERLRLDKEKTENMLKERDMVLEMQMKELEERGEFQKQLEIEVDRLYRLKELKSYCMRISPFRSLREREQEKKRNEVQSLEMEGEDREESVGENALQSPSSSSVSSELVTEK